MSDNAGSNQNKTIVVLISGSGSNLQAIIDGVENGDIPANIAAVISNKADAFGLQRARNSGIDTKVISHTAFDSREAFDTQLASVVDSYSPDLVVLAGFMRILTKTFVNKYLGKMINIHPSLLPQFQGLDTHQRAIDAGSIEHGATVHFVTPELDGGPPILQAKVLVSENETARSLASKVLEKEHVIFPKVVAWMAQEKLKIIDNRVFFENKPIPETGLLLDDSH
ncbi:MAG: phosphoribosylglycinamide formyltransferase [Gammaproteobacteria bacterium]|nr:MAG: phosphoribosylglycinamide formyltransferase [Gammaproteobacteria bacterium]